ncbi:MAG: hypothetical protein WC580_04065, partial [Agrococcus sp.]
MSMSMPEFEMPSEAVAPPDSGIDEPSVAAPAPPPERDASVGPTRPRAGFGWRQLVIACLVGAMLGAAVPTAFEASERSAAAARVDGLRAAALDYLTSIAEGRAELASEVVPLEGGGAVAPDAVLQAAERIEAYEVRLVYVDGDVGSAEVRYRVGGSDVYRTLQAERDGGGWRLMTSLAEVADLAYYDPITRVQIAGVPLGGEAPVLLYPGTYTIDIVSGPIFLTGGDVFVVDGDPHTPTVPYVTAGIVPQISDYATELALVAIAACQAEPGCPVPAEARLEPAGEVYPMGMGTTMGSIDLSVPVTATAESGPEWFEVRVRAVLDESGAPEEWLCGAPGEYGTDLVICGT